MRELLRRGLNAEGFEVAADGARSGSFSVLDKIGNEGPVPPAKD